jgi:hypothetical protein
MSLVHACPFCGTKEPDLDFKTDQGSGRPRKWGFIECRQCGCRGPEVHGHYWDCEAWEGKAIGEWNKRA